MKIDNKLKKRVPFVTLRCESCGVPVMLAQVVFTITVKGKCLCKKCVERQNLFNDVAMWFK